MKNRICKLVSFVLCLALLLGLCLPAQAALTKDGRDTLSFWLIGFDSIFDAVKDVAEDQTGMFMDDSAYDALPDGTLYISMELNSLVVRCGDEYRAYTIENDFVFNYFTSKVCEVVLDQGMLDEGVRVYMNINEEYSGYLDEEMIRFYIDSMAEAG